VAGAAAWVGEISTAFDCAVVQEASIGRASSMKSRQMTDLRIIGKGSFKLNRLY
jgi:hypothetical protein